MQQTIPHARIRSLERPLTADQVAEFEREGFLVIDTPLIAEPELAWCRQILMRMLEGGEGRSEGRNLDLIARDGAIIHAGVHARLIHRHFATLAIENPTARRLDELGFSLEVVGVLHPSRVGEDLQMHRAHQQQRQRRQQ